MGRKESNQTNKDQKVSEYDHEIPQSYTVLGCIMNLGAT